MWRIQGLFAAVVLTVFFLSNGCGSGSQSGIFGLFEPLPGNPVSVVVTTPAAGDNGVLSRTVVVGFSRTLKSATVTATSLLIEGPSGAPVSGQRSVSGNIVTFTTDHAWTSNTTYTIHVRSSVSDIDNNTMWTDYHSTFTTGQIRVVALSAGGGDTTGCCLAGLNDGYLYAWGLNASGMLGLADVTSPPGIPGGGVIAGFQSVPAQVDGPLRRLLVSSPNVYNLGGFDSAVFAVGREHVVAVAGDNSVWAWGAFGGLGNGAATAVSYPFPSQIVGPGGTGFLSGIAGLAAGDQTSYALTSDGRVYGWGANGLCQLGNGTSGGGDSMPGIVGSFYLTPATVVARDNTGILSGIVSIASGIAHGLAVRNDGTVWSWGWNDSGQLGNGIQGSRANPMDSPIPVQVLAPGGVGFLNGVSSVAAGLASSLALLADNTVVQWGFYDPVGVNGSTTPVPVPGPGGAGVLSDVSAISAGAMGSHFLALKRDGTVWAWGNNANGQLGDGTTTGRATPVHVAGPGGVGFLTDVIAVSAGGVFSVAVRRDGTVWAWGANTDGELGNGTTVDSSTPVRVSGLP
jgi:alpha-tubulin suppressor-like RCC1 family protein